eukprot:2384564-Amphidinium_carterae.1
MPGFGRGQLWFVRWLVALAVATRVGQADVRNAIGTLQAGYFFLVSSYHDVFSKQRDKALRLCPVTRYSSSGWASFAFKIEAMEHDIQQVTATNFDGASWARLMQVAACGLVVPGGNEFCGVGSYAQNSTGCVKESVYKVLQQNGPSQQQSPRVHALSDPCRCDWQIPRQRYCQGSQGHGQGLIVASTCSTKVRPDSKRSTLNVKPLRQSSALRAASWSSLV